VEKVLSALLVETASEAKFSIAHWGKKLLSTAFRVSIVFFGKILLYGLGYTVLELVPTLIWTLMSQSSNPVFTWLTRK